MACVALKCGLNAMVLRLTKSVMVAKNGPLMIQLNRHLCVDLIKETLCSGSDFGWLITKCLPQISKVGNHRLKKT